MHELLLVFRELLLVIPEKKGIGARTGLIWEVLLLAIMAARV